MRILIVEDDELIAESLSKTLIDQHYVVDLAKDGDMGLEFIQASTYDLIVLDVGLPKLDGITLCRQLRKQGIKSLVLLLTAEDSTNTKVTGLDAGADDYVTKPFNLQEISARIRALLRRVSSNLPPQLEWENLRLDPSICQVTHNEQVIAFTPKEYSLLELFLRNPHRVFSSDAIIDHLWSFEEPPAKETVRAHMKGMRRKLEAVGSNDPIETIYGVGYRLKPEKGTSVEDKENNKTSKQENKEILQSPNLQQTTQKITAKVWERGKQKLSQRLAIIEEAVTSLFENTTDETAISKAHHEAHKLAGSLGMFGFEFGSRLSREIEEILSFGESIVESQKLRLSELLVGLHRELQLSLASSNPQPVLDERPLLSIVSRDQTLVVELTELAASWGMRSQTGSDPSVVRSLFALDRPDVVLLDFCFNLNENGLRLLAELNCSTPPIPVLVLSTEDNFTDRVKIARLGAQAFLHKPVSGVQVMELVTTMLSRSPTAKVLLVDDDPELLTATEKLLQPWGLSVYTLSNPLEFWDTLSTTNPDLIVLDVEMPDLNGIELCQVLRNDPRFLNLPVIFLTAHSSADTMRRAFAVGADDYVTKERIANELVTRIFNRLQRSRPLRRSSASN